MKTLFLTIICLGMFGSQVLAADLNIKLNFPKKSTAKVTVPKSIQKTQAISGEVTIDITPYPADREEGRYTVEYFLDSERLCSIKGFNIENNENFSFEYKLDTTRFDNGKYKLIVNFWDAKGTAAIGIKEIFIKNK